MNSLKFRHLKGIPLLSVCSLLFLSQQAPDGSLVHPFAAGWNPSTGLTCCLPAWMQRSPACLGCSVEAAPSEPGWSERLANWRGRKAGRLYPNPRMWAPASPAQLEGLSNFSLVFAFEGQANFSVILIRVSFKALMMMFWWKRGCWNQKHATSHFSGHKRGKVAGPVGAASQSQAVQPAQLLCVYHHGLLTC